MSIKFVTLNEADPANVRELLVRGAWKRDWSDEVAQDYIAWRYGARGAGETLIAVEGERCIGILDSFIRPYWIGGRRQAVRETCDWFCLPEYRSFGVGLHLMRRMMMKPEPILVVGGTSYTRDLLPRLKWARLPDVGTFMLPLLAGTVAGLAMRSRWQRGARLARFFANLPLVREIPRLPPPSAKAEARVRLSGDADSLPSIAPYVLAPELETSVLDWLARAPAVLGEFVLLYFFCDGEPAGVSISRLQKLAFGRVAQIAHVHAARFEMIDWMVSETVHQLIARGAGAVLCRTSCPFTSNALSALGFRRRKPIQAFWWPADGLPPPGPFNLTQLQADDALQFT